MRKAISFLAFISCMFTINAQSVDDTVSQGDVLILGEPSGSTYISIDFPRKKSIIKRGSIANFNALVAKRLVVEHLATDTKGRAIATLKRADGLNFFRFFPSVKADISRALKSGELKTL